MSTSIAKSYHKDLFVVAQDRLDAMTDSELTALVKETNGKALQAAKQTLLHVAQTGLVLITLKEKRGHGQFMKEVELWTGISQRTANNYMAITRHYRNVSNLKNISDALRYIKAAPSRALGMDPISSPSPSKPALPLGATYQDAEIVEPSDQVIVAEPQHEEEEPLVVDGITPKQERIPKWIPEDGERLWLLAKTDLDKILKSDKYREEVFNKAIAYCHSRLDAKRDALAAIVATIPRLTKTEIQTLIETLKANLK